MKCSKFLTCLLLTIFYCLKAGAQDSEYVYRDSGFITADSMATRALTVDVKKIKQGDEVHEANTFLHNKQLAKAADSAEALKKIPDFSYVKNLDSLLIALQKKQHTTPVRVNTSWLEKFFFSPIIKGFFWAFACFFIGFILYRLFFTEGFFQYNTRINNVTAIIEKPEAVFATADYTSLISQSVSDKNYRMAIRYHYLQTLQKLMAKNDIIFAPAKTNNQYVHELFAKPYKNEFIALTLQYEYAWYGGFKLDEILFTKIQNNFKQFNSQL